jgi:hypothetical protein
MKEGKYFIYGLNNGSVIRGMKIEGVAWFSVLDFCNASRLNYPRKLKDRLRLSEMTKINLDGASMRCVTLSGLLALVPLKSEYARIRESIVKMIAEYVSVNNPEWITSKPDSKGLEAEGVNCGA